MTSGLLILVFLCFLLTQGDMRLRLVDYSNSAYLMLVYFVTFVKLSCALFII